MQYGAQHESGTDMTMQWKGHAVGVLLAFAALTTQGASESRAQSSPPAGEWPMAGRDYAVVSGVGGCADAVVAGDLDTRDGSAALGFANLMKDLPRHSAKGGMLHVFTLP